MENGSRPSGLADVLVSLEALEVEAQTRADAARAVYDAAMVEVRQIRGMIRAARPAGKPGPKQKPAGRAGSRMGQEELRILLQRIDGAPDAFEDIPGSFTTTTLKNLGMGKGQAERAVRYLRDTEQVRLVGERKHEGAGRLSKVYVIDDGS